MDKKEIEQIIFTALEMANASRGPNEKITISPDAKLFGKDGQLDSLALVALLIDIEEALLEEGYQVFLSDERAMSRSRSPFMDVPSLVKFISDQLQEEHEHES
jgi:acyl carrier protein